MDRAHRIGQTKPVIVYRLYCDNTIENVIMTRAVNKRKLEKLVIKMGKFNTLKKLAFNEQSFLKMNGPSSSTKQPGNKDLVKELSQLLMSNETNIGQTDTSRIEYSGDILDENEMHELLDRTASAYLPHDNKTYFNHIRLFETTSGFDN